VRAADPAQPVSDVATLEEVVGGETAPRVTQLRLLAILSAIALLVAGVGIHGLLTFAVANRARELAVRRALGAPSRGLVAMIVGEGLALAAVGVVAGAALAYPASRAMGALLFGVPPADPLTLAGVVALCAATTIAGCLRPALRATRVSPLAALRG
jgi:ABC-type antimicrobial peptide transport system permease subunit